jgi:serine/threonine protein kinase
MWNTISSKAINLLKLVLNKNPDLRPSAKDVACHLWLNHSDPIPRDSFFAEEINLTKVVHRIRRFIIKERLRVPFAHYTEKQQNGPRFGAHQRESVTQKVGVFAYGLRSFNDHRRGESRH